MDYAQSLRVLTIKGACLTAAFVGIFGLWAGAVPITGAVVTSGQLVVNHNVRKVQHPTGGVVGEILAREGDIVKAGQVVLRLDETVIRATLTGITKKIDELEARIARLNAERTGYSELKFTKGLLDRHSDTEVAEILTTERSLFDARKASHELRKSRLSERVGQLMQELESLIAELEAKKKLAAITAKELAGLKSLENLRLVNTQRLNTIERDAVTVQGQQQQLAASIAQTQGKIVETKMQSSSLDDELRAEVTKELREAQGELAQQLEKRAAATDQLQRIDVRAPASGKVHQSIAHTVGGVITAAEPVMLIVPMEEQLELEVRVQPQDIDLIFVGQPALIKLNAFNRRLIPDIDGEVTRVSADISKDQQTGALYFNARLAIDPASVAKIAALKLQPGMQADAFVRTSERTMLQYMFHPIAEQFRRSLRER